MQKPLTLHDKAGRLIRLTAWLALIPIPGIMAATVIPALPERNYAAIMIAGLISIVAILAIRLLLYVGASVKANKRWAKIFGLIYGFVLLLSVPVGTFIGIFLLYYLIGGWQVSVDDAEK